MSFWATWKARWKWDEGRFRAVKRWLISSEGWRKRWTWARQTTVARPVLVSLVALAALFLTVGLLRNGQFYWDWLKGGAGGQIIVNSPTVYTRQRLVNDRLSQAAWLQKQLLAAEKNFRSVDQVFRSVEQRQLALGLKTDGSSADEGKKPDQPAADPILVEATTPAEFRAKNLYRDEVRAEITQTQLDDRHDISGNTIYRLAFDATVVAGSRRDAVAGIKITLGHKPFKTPTQQGEPELPELNMVYREDYDRLYADWVRHMQVQVATSVESMTTSISVGSVDAKVRQLLMRYLLSETCRLKLEIQSASNKECNPERFSPVEDKGQYEQADANRKATLQFISEQFPAVFKKRDGRSKAEFDGRLTPILLAFDDGFRKAVENKKKADETKADEKSANEKDSKEKTPEEAQRAILDGYYEYVRLFCAQADSKDYDLKTLFPRLQEKTPIGCPLYDSPAERLKAGILIYDDLARLKEVRQGKGAPTDLAKDLQDQRDHGCPDKPAEAFCSFIRQQTATRCFAAEFIKANLNRTDPKRWRQIEYLLSLQIVGRETNRCDLLVSETAYPASTVNELKYILNENTEAFAYSVTPKNLTENASTASETRDTVALLGRYGLPGSSVGITANQLQQRSSQLRAVLAHPVVVGFGSGTRRHEIVEHPEPDRHPLNKGRKTVSVREIELGWIVAPRIRDRGLEQIDNQYTLTAVISVPSWWRSIELDIQTCWTSREQLHAIGVEPDGTLTICRGLEKPANKPVVRLPGAISELSRKLGFDVLQEPYLADNQRQVLEIGQPGSLLLRGARLWRSTEVTLGAQKADNIVVLPNMDGIVAQFTCVLPQFRATGYDYQPIDVNAYVWTSEGVTTGAPVTLIWSNAPPPSDKPPTGQQETDKPPPGKPETDKQTTGKPETDKPPPGKQETDRQAAARQEIDKQAADKMKIKWCPDLYPKPGTQ